MKLWWSLLAVGVALPMIISAASAEADLWEEDEKEVLVRTVRGTKERGAAAAGNGSGGAGAGSSSCRYRKGEWSECDAKTNLRTRTLTLKNNDKSCEQTKTITKTCKNGKACRYEKGSWSSCLNQNMMRVDNLKPNSDPTCEKTRRMNKRCKPERNAKKGTKDRSNKKAIKQQ